MTAKKSDDEVKDEVKIEIAKHEAKEAKKEVKKKEEQFKSEKSELLQILIQTLQTQEKKNTQLIISITS